MIKYSNIPVRYDAPETTTISAQSNTPEQFFGDISASETYKQMSLRGTLPSQSPKFISVLDMPDGPEKQIRLKKLIEKLL